MKRTFLCGVVAGALGLAPGLASLAFAGSVYVPILDMQGTNGSSHTTDVWISNSGTVDRPFTSAFLAEDSDGTKRADKPSQVQVAAGRTSVVNGVSANGKVGLLELNSTSKFLIDARLTSAHINANLVSFSTVPVISSDNLLATGAWAYLVGLERDGTRGDHTDLNVVNLGQAETQCQIKLFRSNGTQIGSTAIVTMKALSLRQFADALSTMGEQNAKDVRAEVSCNQPFYAFASLFKASISQYLFLVPSASGASTLTSPGEQPVDPESSGGLVFQKSGLIHIPTLDHQKETIDIPVSRAMGLKRLIVDLDFVPGPWNRLKIPGNHNIIWLHRNVGSNEFRSNSIVNVNAFGPNKYTIKMNQNVDMAARTQTVAEQGVQLVQGQTYHLRYTYDAENRAVTAVVSQGGTAVTTLQMEATAYNRTLNVEPGKLRAEFGHYNNQEGPELASFGWQYLNLRVEMVPY